MARPRSRRGPRPSSTRSQAPGRRGPPAPAGAARRAARRRADPEQDHERELQRHLQRHDRDHDHDHDHDHASRASSGRRAREAAQGPSRRRARDRRRLYLRRQELPPRPTPRRSRQGRPPHLPGPPRRGGQRSPPRRRRRRRRAGAPRGRERLTAQGARARPPALPIQRRVGDARGLRTRSAAAPPRRPVRRVRPLPAGPRGARRGRGRMLAVSPPLGPCAPCPRNSAPGERVSQARRPGRMFVMVRAGRRAARTAGRDPRRRRRRGCPRRSSPSTRRFGRGGGRRCGSDRR